MSTPSTGRLETHRPPAQRDSPAPPAEPPEDDLGLLSLPELRTVRRDAQRDEADLSYVRRLLQGRIDILRAERTARLKGKGVGEVDVEALTDILSSRSSPTPEGDG